MSNILAQIALVSLTSIKLLSFSPDTPTVHFSYFDTNLQAKYELGHKYLLTSQVPKPLYDEVPCHSDSVTITLSREITAWPDSTIDFTVPCASNSSYHIEFSESGYEYRVEMTVDSSRYERKIFRINDIMMLGEALSATTNDEVKVHIESDVPGYTDLDCPRFSDMSTYRNSLIRFRGMAIPCV